MYFGGDVVLAHRVQEMAGNDTTYIFRKWNPMNPLDIFMVNLENPVTGATEKIEKEFNFKMHPIHLSTLRNGGINIVNCANNHMHDFGEVGILESMNFLDSYGIARVGVGKNIEEARTPKIFTIKGKKIGFLGYGGWSFAATKKKPGIAFRSIDIVSQDIKKLRPEVDVIIVNFHWGEELAETVNVSQTYLARKTIDAGADVIIGHHPHILQGIEKYKEKTIAYSLGNFVFGGNARHTYETAVLSVELIGEKILTSLVPVSVKKFQPQIATQNAKKKTLQLVEQRSKQFKKTISFH